MKISEVLVNGRNHKLVCEIDGVNFGEFFIIEGENGNLYFSECEEAIKTFYELEA